MPSTLLRHPLIAEFMDAGLAGEGTIVAGSGPLLARGIIEDISDLDVVARGAAWDHAVQLAGPPVQGPSLLTPEVSHQTVWLCNGQIEVVDHWFNEIWDQDTLFESAEHLDGIAFLPLAMVRDLMQRLRRPKDLVRLRMLARSGL